MRPSRLSPRKRAHTCAPQSIDSEFRIPFAHPNQRSSGPGPCHRVQKAPRIHMIGAAALARRPLKGDHTPAPRDPPKAATGSTPTDESESGRPAKRQALGPVVPSRINAAHGAHDGREAMELVNAEIDGVDDGSAAVDPEHGRIKNPINLGRKGVDRLRVDHGGH